MLDRALGVAMIVWALLGVLPIGAWTRVSDGAYYAGAWALWGRTLVVVALSTVLVVMLGGERAAATGAAIGHGRLELVEERAITPRRDSSERPGARLARGVAVLGSGPLRPPRCHCRLDFGFAG